MGICPLGSTGTKQGFMCSAQGNNTILFVCFVAVRAKSTGMVMAGHSVYLTNLFPGQA